MLQQPCVFSFKKTREEKHDAAASVAIGAFEIHFGVSFWKHD